MTIIFSVFLLFENKIEYLWPKQHGIKSLKTIFVSILIRQTVMAIYLIIEVFVTRSIEFSNIFIFIHIHLRFQSQYGGCVCILHMYALRVEAPIPLSIDYGNSIDSNFTIFDLH